MYLEHFGLTVSPFGISPRLDFLYKSSAFEESMAHLVYGLDSSEAIVMITGAIGTGKTMAVQSFLSHLGERYVSALITNTSVDGLGLLKLLLDDLGAPVEPGADKSDLLIAFKKFLIEAGREGRRIIIVIDEAQNLSREVLEEIRQLTNLGQGNEQPVQVVLVGQPELDSTVARPDLAQLRQRIRVHYKLAPLTRRELEEYVDHRMTVAGGSRGVFAARALDRIYELSGGVPRVVNTLCSDALLSAFVAGRRKVEAADVAEGGGEALPASPVERPAPEPAPPVKKAMPVAAPAPPTPAPPPAEPAAPAARGAEPVKHRGRSGMAARRGRAATGRSGRPRRRGAGLWAAAAVVVVAAAALALTGRLDFLTGADDGRDAGPGAAALERQDDALPAVKEPDPAATGRPASTDAVPAADAPDTAAAEATAPATGALDATVAAEPPARGEDVRAAAERPEPATAAPAVVATGSDTPQLTPAVSGPAASVPAATPDGEHYIHVSSFKTAPHAGAVATKFSEGGLPAVVREQTVRDVLWYRVYLGPFGTHDDAVRLANRLREEGTITYYKVVRAGAGEGL